MSALKYDSPLKGIFNGLSGRSLSVIGSQYCRRSGALLVVAYGLRLGTPLSAETIAGDAILIDGRTLMLSGQMLRLWGLDASDLDQTCTWGEKLIPRGRHAQGALMDLIIGAVIRCERRR